MTEKPKCLVLGATGMVGGAVLRSLSGAKDLVVRATARTDNGRAALSELADEIVNFDYEVQETYGSALEGIDRIFLLTGYTVDMMHQSKFLVDMAAEAGVKHVVHLGTHAPNNTVFKHHSWHQLVERYIEWHGLGFTHLRPGMFMANILNYAKANKDQLGVLIHYTGGASGVDRYR